MIRALFDLKGIFCFLRILGVDVNYLFLLFLFQILSASHPIAVDALFDDWVDVSVTYDDPEGDGTSEDFGQLKITNDDDFIFFLLEFLDGEHLMQDWNNIHLYIDADDDFNTGLPIHGIGAELDWCFGCREGEFHFQDDSIGIWQNDLTLRSTPTTTGERFEWCISRESIPLTMDGSQEVSTMRVTIVSSDGGDYLPDHPGGVTYTIDTTHVPPPEPTPLEREETEQIRLVTYNILHNGFFEEAKREHFYRIIQALDPDILAVQEAWGDQDEIAMLMAEWIPGTWYVSSEWGGNYVISRFPILEETVLISSNRSMAVYLDIEAELCHNLLVINSHFSCCSANKERQQEMDELMSVMREWMKPDSWMGPFYLEVDTPILHVGDFNLVGNRQQLVTLTEGDIVDEDSYGEDFGPDWDGSFITDLFSHQTDIRMGYTWRYDESSFSPGKLDYILYMDSVLEIARHYVLNTMAMSEQELTQYGLEEWDVYLASDHMPRVVDISGVDTGSMGADGESFVPEGFQIYPAYPNPFNATTRIRYNVPKDTDVRITIYDILGREIRKLVNTTQDAGYQSVIWDSTDEFGRSVGTGIYLYQIQAGDFSQTKKMLLLR